MSSNRVSARERYKTPSDSLGFDASWEIDLFGHVRRSVEAARADLGAERANYEDAQVTVAAEVARNYFELRGVQKRLDVARENLDSERKTLELTQLLDQTGRGSELDVERSRARFKATEAAIPPLEAAEQQAGYRLAVLLGQRPGTLDEELKAAPVAIYAKALAGRATWPGCCANGPMCGPPNSSWPPRRRAWALPRPICFRG